MARELTFERQLPLIDRGLTFLAAFICLPAIVFTIKSDASELSIMIMISSLIIALTIYLFKLLAIGLSHSMLLLSEDIQIKPAAPISQIRHVQKKVSTFGLCTFCNQFETKNTLSGRYVCSGCYKIFLQVKGHVLTDNFSDASRMKRSS